MGALKRVPLWEMLQGMFKTYRSRLMGRSNRKWALVCFCWSDSYRKLILYQVASVWHVPDAWIRILRTPEYSVCVKYLINYLRIAFAFFFFFLVRCGHGAVVQGEGHVCRSLLDGSSF